MLRKVIRGKRLTNQTKTCVRIHLNGLTQMSSFLYDAALVAPAIALGHFREHDKPQVSNPRMIQSGWHSVKIKCWNPDCIDFNWNLLTGKAIWYPIINLSLNEFLSLLCGSLCKLIIFLAFERSKEDWNHSAFLGLVMDIGFYHKMGDIR